MKINSVDKNTSFGWKFKTHEQITSLIVEDFPKLAKYKKTLITSVIKPDFDERGFKGNNHFYYKPEMFRPRESFLDMLGKNNAGARYALHMYQFKKFLNKNNEKSMEHAGRALHFLQDITQPQHTERGTVFKKWKDLKVHLGFENFVLNNQDRLITQSLKNCMQIGNEYKNYSYAELGKLFIEKVHKSTAVTPPNNKNQHSWDYIAQYGISNAIDATKSFFEMISECVK